VLAVVVEGERITLGIDDVGQEHTSRVTLAPVGLRIGLDAAVIQRPLIGDRAFRDQHQHGCVVVLGSEGTRGLVIAQIIEGAAAGEITNDIRPG
jgi:hypothetical protein